MIELYISDCGALVLQNGDHKYFLATADSTFSVNTWYFISMVYYNEDGSNDYNTYVELRYTSDHTGTLSSDSATTRGAIATGFKSDYYIGSLFGQLNNYVGYMGNIEIVNLAFDADASIFAADFDGVVANCAGCTAGYCDWDDNCYADADCEWNQYDDAGCTACHSSCKYGCTASGPCSNVCDESCATCTAENPSDCLTCQENAHRIS